MFHLPGIPMLSLSNAAYYPQVWGSVKNSEDRGSLMKAPRGVKSFVPLRDGFLLLFLYFLIVKQSVV